MSRQRSHLLQLVLLLHLAAVVEVPEPARHVQPLVRVLLRVGLRGRQLGPADGELHTRFLVGELLNGGKHTKQRRQRPETAAECETQQSSEQGNLSVCFAWD